MSAVRTGGRTGGGMRPPESCLAPFADGRSVSVPGRAERSCAAPPLPHYVYSCRPEHVVATGASQFQSAAASIRSIDGASRPVMAFAVLAGGPPGAVT